MSLLTSLFRLVPPSFRAGYCPTSIQQLANDLINGTQVTFLIQQGSFLYNMGSATPAPENRSFPWLYTPTGQWYTFQLGLWVSPMDPTGREPGFRRLWKPPAGTLESAAWALDGGTGQDPAITPPTAINGAAWAIDHDFDGRMPIGVGTIPGTSPAISVGISATTDSDSKSGDYRHLLTIDELPAHHHALQIFDGPVAGGTHPQSYIGTTSQGTFNTDDTGGGLSFMNAPPFIGVWWLKPTAKLFYTLPA